MSWVHCSRDEMRQRKKIIPFCGLFWFVENCPHSGLNQNPGIFVFTTEFWHREHPPVCQSWSPWKTQSSWLWYPAGALLRNHRDELAEYQQKLQSSSGGRFPMWFHHNCTILVKNLHSEEVKNSKKKIFSLSFLNIFNVNYSCYGRRQIISVTHSWYVRALRALRTVLSLPSFPEASPQLAQVSGPHFCPPGLSVPAPVMLQQGSSSSQPCPAQPLGHKTKDLHFFPVKLMLTCQIDALISHAFNWWPSFLAVSQLLLLWWVYWHLRAGSKSSMVTKVHIYQNSHLGEGLEKESSLPGLQEKASSS